MVCMRGRLTVGELKKKLDAFPDDYPVFAYVGGYEGEYPDFLDSVEESDFVYRKRMEWHENYLDEVRDHTEIKDSDEVFKGVLLG